MRLYDPLLYPFSWLYHGVTKFRNLLFDQGNKKSIPFSIPIISVGNLSMGGTGKTPMVEFLVSALKDDIKIAVLSRGYGRKSSGFLLADEQMAPSRLGDEPFQIYAKFKAEVAVAVGENRVESIPLILAEKPGTALILLDDAYQHRYVQRDLNILLTTHQLPFFQDRVFPLGTLREHPDGAQRADWVVVTKCPDHLEKAHQAKMIQRIQDIAKKPVPVVFTGIQYGDPYPISENSPSFTGNVILMTGIANSQAMVEYVKGKFTLLDTLDFPDHHAYVDKDFENLKKLCTTYATQTPVVLTTEKDAVKLKEVKFLKYLREIAIFALPMELKMAQADRDALIAQIKMVVKDKGYQSEH